MCLTFGKGRNFVRKKRFKNQQEWFKYCSTERPPCIPSSPHIIYKSQWRGFGDWLGNGNSRKNRGKDLLSFYKARAYVRRLGFKRNKDWKKWVDSRPNNVPRCPNLTYKDEWQGWDNWLRRKKSKKTLEIKDGICTKVPTKTAC